VREPTSAKGMDAQLQALDDELAGWEAPAQRLREALDKDELALFCQPIAALQGAVRFPMAEVLIRLREEEQALLPPGEFLPVFEHYRLMPDLDRWVVRKVAQHLARGSRIPRYDVNLSTQTLEDPAFPQAVAGALEATGVAGGALLFEIAESDVLGKLDAAVRFASAVRALGCGIVVSGFGRRSASFMPLKSLRPDYVKIDGVIVRKLLSALVVEAKLKSILRVGEVMGFQCIAEMVEEQDILLRLKAMGVSYAQGFGIQQPHPIEKLAR
jgi:EAL domain-containing protein (putative c-di-GMP-specific phosphodiesterase class I)